MKHDKTIETGRSGHGPPAFDLRQPLAPLTLQPEDYKECLDGFDLTDEQQLELLQALWNIMSMLVDIGWGVDTVQILLPEVFGNTSTDSKTQERGDCND